MAYEELSALLGQSGTDPSSPDSYATGGLPQGSGLDPQTLELLKTIFRKPVEPQRPASPTPFSQQGRGDKAQTITAALADVARLIQNSNRPTQFGQRPVGFLGQLEGDRQATADQNAQADYQSRVGADQMDRSRAGFELSRRDRAQSDQERRAREDAKAIADQQRDEFDSFEGFKDHNREIVARNLPDEQYQEFISLGPKQRQKAESIVGRAYAHDNLVRKEKDAQDRSDRLAAEARAPEAKPPNETDQRIYSDSLTQLDSVVTSLPDQLAAGALTPAQVRAEFKTRIGRLDGVMHPALIARYEAEYSRAVEPLLTTYEESQKKADVEPTFADIAAGKAPPRAEREAKKRETARAEAVAAERTPEKRSIRDAIALRSLRPGMTAVLSDGSTVIKRADGSVVPVRTGR